MLNYNIYIFFAVFLVTKVTDIYFMFTILAILFYLTMIKRLIKNCLFKFLLCHFVCGMALSVTALYFCKADYVFGD